MKWSCEE